MTVKTRKKEALYEEIMRTKQRLVKLNKVNAWINRNTEEITRDCKINVNDKEVKWL